MKNCIMFIFAAGFLAPNVLTKQPNIVIVLADDYGWHDVGYHGSPISTPNLDQLAAEGVKLENYYVQPLCSPSRSVLMSGLSPIRTGAQHLVYQPCQNATLPLDIVTLPQKLRSLGYSTNMVGKWHLGYPSMKSLPTNRGFDTFFGFLNGGLNSYYNYSLCFFNPEQCGFDMMEGTTLTSEHSGPYTTHLFSNKASQVIENHDESKPLFLYVSYQAPHTPLEAPEEYVAPYESTIPNRERQIFAGMVSAMDEGIGNITESLKKKGIWKDTLILFSADNGGTAYGGSVNTPLRGMKGTFFEGGVRAVGFVSGPRVEAKGTVNQQLMHISDWYPTLINLAGGDLEGADLDGYDQWGTINKNQTSPRYEILFNIDPLFSGYGESVSEVFDTGVHAALRMGDYKIITGVPIYDEWSTEPVTNESIPYIFLLDLLRNSYNYSREGQNPKNVWLFNVVDDPEERTDLSLSHPIILELMLQRLAYYNHKAVPVQSQVIDPQCDPALNNGYWLPVDWPGFNVTATSGSNALMYRFWIAFFIVVINL